MGNSTTLAIRINRVLKERLDALATSRSMHPSSSVVCCANTSAAFRATFMLRTPVDGLPTWPRYGHRRLRATMYADSSAERCSDQSPPQLSITVNTTRRATCKTQRDATSCETDTPGISVCATMRRFSSRDRRRRIRRRPAVRQAITEPRPGERIDRPSCPSIVDGHLLALPTVKPAVTANRLARAGSPDAYPLLDQLQLFDVRRAREKLGRVYPTPLSNELAHAA